MARLQAGVALVIIYFLGVITSVQYPVEFLGFVEVSNPHKAQLVAPGQTTEITLTLPRTLVPESDHILRSSEDDTLELHIRSYGEETVEFAGTWTAPEREMLVVHNWALHSSSRKMVALVQESTAVEVTCSDGVFCNGVERYIDGKCKSSHPSCEDFDSCTEDTCDEAKGRCYNIASRPECKCFSDCVIDCDGKECGEDGCGGFCGSCADGEGCSEGQCVAAVSDGTCSSPLPLLDSNGIANFFTQTHFVQGDTSLGINTYFPVCNTLSGAQEIFYEFVVPDNGAQFVTIEAMMSGFDTVLQLQEGVCQGTVIACSDDSSPPGFLGSRVKASLVPGKTYLLMCDGYNLEQKGPFELRINFHEDCVSDCDGLFCGDDGCGGSCGECEGNDKCQDGACYPDPCTPNCESENRECGDDGCGGSCGECDTLAGSYCVTDTDEDGNVFYTGVCSEAYTPCDHFNPTCTGCTAQQFCASDCECYNLNDPLPDLVLDVDILSTQIYVDVNTFTNTSCAVAEGCVPKPGNRALLRFSAVSINQGDADFFPPPPKTRPDIFVYGQCHRHYHFTQFSEYILTDPTGKSITRGKKEAYCMEDSYQYVQGNNVNCLPSYDCGAQGIQRGWADVYGATLDCQWIDISNVSPGEYKLSVAINPNRVFAEKSFDNNMVVIHIQIPEFDINVTGTVPVVVYEGSSFYASSGGSDSQPQSSHQSSHHHQQSSHTTAQSPSSSASVLNCLWVLFALVLLVV